MTQRQCLWFDAPYRVGVRDEPIPQLEPTQVLVETLVSAISAGTELLFYRDQVPPQITVDASINTLAGDVRYPLRYGYACVGRVVELGAQVAGEWRKRLVFSFQPHASHFVASVDELIPIPETISPEQAAFLANMETAINFLMDGSPIIGERVVVLGQGVVGLITTGLLAHIPLAHLLTFDRFPLRRQLSRDLGATESFDPNAAESIQGAKSLLTAIGADLAYELTGTPDTLNLAIDLTGFCGRIIIGSWYGQKRAPIDLGGSFHRSRIRMISSQVSTIAPEFAGRWNKVRRMETVRHMLARLPLSHLITHRFPISDAAQAYALLDQHPEQALQVLFTY